MTSIHDLQAAVRSAGGNNQDAYTVAGIAYCLTLGDPSWRQADGVGAWAVSQKWYPGTPGHLDGQAKQALDIYRRRGIVGAAESVSLAAIMWWYPSGDAPREFKERMAFRSGQYAAKAKPGFQLAGLGLGWILIAGVALWYFFGRK